MNRKTLCLLVAALTLSWTAARADYFGMGESAMLSRAGFSYDERAGWVDAEGKPISEQTVARLRAQGGIQKLSLDGDSNDAEVILIKGGGGGGGFSGGGRSSGGGFSSGSRSYSAPSAPSRSYSAPSAPSRTYTAPAAPSRSTSSPSIGTGTTSTRPRTTITSPSGQTGTQTQHRDGKGFTQTFKNNDGSTKTTVQRYDKAGNALPPVTHTTHLDNSGNRVRTIESSKGTTTMTRSQDGRTTTHSFTDKNGVSTTRTMTRDTSMVNGQKTTVVRQTTVVNGQTVVVNRTYHHYTYGGYSYPIYVYPMYPFAPVWHPFFYNPWVAPMCYSFWTGYAPCYPSASYLIADLILLDAAHNAQVRADEARRAAEQARLAQLAAEDKAQIRAQVDAAMKAYEASHDQGGTNATTLDTVFNNPKTVFRVHEDMEATEIGADGEESDDTCQLGEGDLLKVAVKPDEGDTSVTMKVVGVGAGDDRCELHSKVSLPVANVQEMVNEFNHKVQTKMDKVKDAKDKKDSGQQSELTDSGAGSSNFQ